MKYLLPILLLLSGCGADSPPPTPNACVSQTAKTKELNLGSLEKIDCGPGEVIVTVTPHWTTGGILTHVIVQCGKVTIVCR